MGDSTFWNGVFELLDSFVNPQLISVKIAAEQYSSIVVIAWGFMMYSIFNATLGNTVFRNEGKGWIIAAAVGFTLIAATVTSAFEMFLIVFGVFGSLMKMIAGATLLFDALNRRAVGLLYLLSLILAVFAGVFVLKAFPGETLGLFKLVLAVFSAVGVYQFFLSRDLEIRWGKEWAVGMAILVGFTSILSFENLIELGDLNVITTVANVANNVFFTYPFGVGMVIGGFAWWKYRA